MAVRGRHVAMVAVAAVLAGAAANGMRDPVVPVAPRATVAIDATRISFAPRPIEMPDGRSRPIRSLLNMQGAMQFGDYRWNDDVPPGDVWVRVDLAHQTVSVFRGDNEIGTAVILYGTDGKSTPTGNFPILAKAMNHRSSLYDAEMPFMLRLTGDGVAIHASTVRRGSATHGCIGVPAAFAERLFAVVHRGDPVAIMPPKAGRVA